MQSIIVNIESKYKCSSQSIYIKIPSIYRIERLDSHSRDKTYAFVGVLNFHDDGKLLYRVSYYYCYTFMSSQPYA